MIAEEDEGVEDTTITEDMVVDASMDLEMLQGLCIFAVTKYDTLHTTVPTDYLSCKTHMKAKTMMVPSNYKSKVGEEDIWYLDK